MFMPKMSDRKVLSMDEIRRLAPSVFATQPHHAVSAEYRFIPTVDMVNTLTSQGWEVVQAGEHRVRNASKAGFQKHMLRFRNPNLPKIGNGDSEIDLVVMNSHDRTSAFRFLAGLFRFVCANGMVAGENLFQPISVKHIGYKADAVIEASYRIIDSVPKVAESVDAMKSLILSDDERRAFANAALITKYGAPEEGKALPITANCLLKPRRTDDTAKDLWTTLNVVQENAIRGGQRDYSVPRGSRRLTRGVESISENTKLNQGLWALAEEMKKLKIAA